MPRLRNAPHRGAIHSASQLTLEESREEGGGNSELCLHPPHHPIDFSILFKALYSTGNTLHARLSGGKAGRAARAHLREDVNSEKEAQPVSFAGIGSSVLQTSDPTESKGAPCVVSMGTSKLADQLGAKKERNSTLRMLQ